MTTITITVDGEGINVTAPETGETEKKTAKILEVINELHTALIGNAVVLAGDTLEKMFEAVQNEIVKIAKD